MLAPFCFLADGTEISKCQVSASFCCFTFEERFLSLGLSPSAPGRRLVQERGRRRAAHGAAGEMGWGAGCQLIDRTSVRRAAGAVL